MKVVSWSLEWASGSQIFKQSFKKYFEYYVSGTIVNAKNMAINKTDKVLSSQSLYSSGEHVLYTNKRIYKVVLEDDKCHEGNKIG